jgi:hypothetical protein
MFSWVIQKHYRRFIQQEPSINIGNTFPVELSSSPDNSGANNQLGNPLKI